MKNRAFGPLQQPGKVSKKYFRFWSTLIPIIFKFVSFSCWYTIIHSCIMTEIGKLEDEAFKRKERLKSLKQKRCTDESESPEKRHAAGETLPK